MLKKNCLIPTLLVAALLLVAPATVAADEVVKVTNYGDALVFDPVIEAEDFVLDVTGPCNYKLRQTLSKDRELVFQLDETTIDGRYRFQVAAVPHISSDIKEALQKARVTGDGTEDQLCRDGRLPGAPQVQDAGFGVIKGEIVYDPESVEKVATLEKEAAPEQQVNPVAGALLGGQHMTLDPEALEKQVISGDLVVYNSICVGFDCPTNPTFGADTIRLQENNLRIHFDDTSTASSFPNRDWRILVNDQANGGLSRFSIEDATGARIPFTIEAGATSNAIYADNGGRVGFGTSNPVLELHARNGDSPGLRLEQDTSSGFAAQTWDLAGNETSFFIRDATNGSTLPFRVFPGSSSSSLVIRNSNVGVGVTSPSEKLHVRATDGTASVLVEEASGTTSDRTLLELSNNGGASLVLEDTSNQTWEIKGKAGLQFSRSGSGVVEMLMNANGDLTISGGLVTGTAGSCTNATPCDGVFDPTFEVPSIEENAVSMWSNRHLPAVGPTLPGKPVNLTKKTLSMLHELEKAHIYIEQLHLQMKAQQGQMEEMARLLEELRQDQ